MGWFDSDNSKYAGTYNHRKAPEPNRWNTSNIPKKFNDRYGYPEIVKVPREKKPKVDPWKYNQGGGYPQEHGDEMMGNDDGVPIDDDSQGIVPIGFSRETTLNDATFEDRSLTKSRKGPPAPINTLNSLKELSKKSKVPHDKVHWRRSNRQSVLHSTRKAYDRAYGKHKTRKFKDRPKELPSPVYYPPVDYDTTQNGTTTYQAASDRPPSALRKDSGYDSEYARPPPPSPAHEKAKPTKTKASKHARDKLQEYVDRSRAYKQRNEKSNKSERPYSYTGNEELRYIREPEVADVAVTKRPKKSDTKPKRSGKSRTQPQEDIAGLREQIAANAVALFPQLLTTTSPTRPENTFVTVISAIQPRNEHCTYTARLAYHTKPSGALQQIGQGEQASDIPGALSSLLHLTAVALMTYNTENDVELLGPGIKAERRWNWSSHLGLSDKTENAFLDKALLEEGVASVESKAQEDHAFLTNKKYDNRKVYNGPRENTVKGRRERQRDYC